MLYASHLGPGASNVPGVGPEAHGFAGVETHLTLDLPVIIRFGPNIEWVALQGRANSQRMRVPSTFGPHIS